MSQLTSEFASFGRTGAAIVQAIQSLEAAKAVLTTNSLARYGTMIDTAKQDLTAAEAVFGSDVSVRESQREQVAAAHARLQKCKCDVEEAKELVRSSGLTSDALIDDVINQAKNTVARGLCFRLFGDDV